MACRCKPKKGHLLITDRYPGLIRHQLLELGYIKSAHQAAGTSVAFNAQPRPTGQLLIGSSRQFDTTDPAVEMPVLAQMLQRAARISAGVARRSTAFAHGPAFGPRRRMACR